MKIKICGLKYGHNIQAVSAMRPDMVGFIFYAGSKRFAGDVLDVSVLDKLPESVQKVGVFVNEDPDTLFRTAEAYGLDTIQLHGSEPPEYCAAVKARGYGVIKAVPVADRLHVNRLARYRHNVHLFLFDTATAGHGGSGKTFSHDLLQGYDLDIPFFMGGGLGNANAGELLRFTHPMLAGIDANSMLEDSPGLKNVTRVQTFINTIRNAAISTGR